MKRLILLAILVMAMAVLAHAAFADDVMDADAVESLRSGEEVGHKVGWGVVYKLMFYGFDPAESESGWALGELRKICLAGDDPADLHMKILGQAKKAAKDKQKHEG